MRREWLESRGKSDERNHHMCLPFAPHSPLITKLEVLDLLKQSLYELEFSLAAGLEVQVRNPPRVQEAILILVRTVHL